MLTLTQAQLYSENMVYQGIVEEFIRRSVVFQELPFIEVQGNAYQYVRESTRSSVAFRDANEVWSENTGTVAQVTVGLKILGGDADIDEFLKATRSNYTDIEAELIMEKVKSMKFGFLDAFYYGDSTVNSKEFSGLHSLVTSGNTIERGSGSAGQAPRISDLDQLMDTVTDGGPDCIMMPAAIRRRINAYTRANGLYEANRNSWGDMIAEYQGVPMYLDDSLVMTESVSGTSYSAKTGGATGTIFAVRFGTGVFGIQNSGSIQVVKVNDLIESKDAARWRVKWYCGLGLKQTFGLAAITGMTDAAAVS